MACICNEKKPTPCPDCERCIEPPVYRARLDYVPDLDTGLALVDIYGSSHIDLLPQIRAGETDTSWILIPETRRMRYLPERFTWSEGKQGVYWDICIPDVAALIDLNELRNVVSVQPQDGETIIFNSVTNRYEMYDLAGNIKRLDDRIDATNVRIDNVEKQIAVINQTLADHTRKINNLYEIYGDLSNRVTKLEETVAAIDNRLKAIENAIYNWEGDKNTKIPRGTINITSGGYNSNWIIQSRAKNQDQDLNFE